MQQKPTRKKNRSICGVEMPQGRDPSVCNSQAPGPLGDPTREDTEGRRPAWAPPAGGTGHQGGPRLPLGGFWSCLVFKMTHFPHQILISGVGVSCGFHQISSG